MKPPAACIYAPRNSGLLSSGTLSGCCHILRVLTKTSPGASRFPASFKARAITKGIMADSAYLSSSTTENKWSKNGFGEPVSRDVGKFSREESETIRNAVEEYCAAKQISTARLCSECDHKAELKGAWMEIGMCNKNCLSCLCF